ncbi:MAG TPA: DNA integrity scanning diadenylate cyclase DisA [Propionibacteriaceae bacterium]|nr:DNA integrity scanning diadenylate cyclase DisA [Propionibacteriaceae bacterium]HPZ48772.1 DNA integrity scanning diadenylate cyclase DisA [Propionibacteriaceae bacterium]HQE30403.1 DNA integrity scanning diadenylate cyclase DisA [Propionibacteriaceae bacterium]
MTDVALLRRHQALLAPGTGFRDGLDRIVSGRTGALVVVGTNAVVESASTGGFRIDVDFTPTALRELAKLDGGIVVTADLSRILCAGVHFMPDPAVPTAETGTRHRTADRMSQQAGVPVVTVSASMSTIALYLHGHRHVVERPEADFARANQALNTLSRYRERLRDAADALSALEVSDQVTARDVALTAQRYELAHRLADEIRGYVVTLGVDGRLIALQLHELTLGTASLGNQLESDYRPDGVESAMRIADLAGLSDDQLLDVSAVSRTLGIGGPETRLTPRGFRQLAQIPRLPPAVAARLLDHFGGLQGVLTATRAELTEVDGIGDVRARAIRDDMLRISEAAYARLT